MDEMGRQEWADRQEGRCYVIATVSKDQIPVPIPRYGKRITVLASIATNGSHLKPFVIIPRKIVNANLILSGLTAEKIAVSAQPKGFVNPVLFQKWLTS
jgi:hypothetical protein